MGNYLGTCPILIPPVQTGLTRKQRLSSKKMPSTW